MSLSHKTRETPAKAARIVRAAKKDANRSVPSTLLFGAMRKVEYRTTRQAIEDRARAPGILPSAGGGHGHTQRDNPDEFVRFRQAKLTWK